MIQIKSPMVGYEPESSGLTSNHSTNYATDLFGSVFMHQAPIFGNSYFSNNLLIVNPSTGELHFKGESVTRVLTPIINLLFEPF